MSDYKFNGLKKYIDIVEGKDTADKDDVCPDCHKDPCVCDDDKEKTNEGVVITPEQTIARIVDIVNYSNK